MPSREFLQTFLLWYNAIQVLMWGTLIAPTMIFWSHSIPWLALMSVWANFAGAVAGLTAALLSRQMNDS